jgi:hypothetical protein
MNARDLKIAAIITAACLLLSLGASYSYTHGLYWTDGVLPLALAVILLFLATVVLDAVGTRANARVMPSLGGTKGDLRSAPKSSAATIGPVDLLLSPFHVLIFLLLVILEVIHSILLWSRRPHGAHVAPHGAHS